MNTLFNFAKRPFPNCFANLLRWCENVGFVLTPVQKFSSLKQWQPTKGVPNSVTLPLLGSSLRPRFGSSRLLSMAFVGLLSVFVTLASLPPAWTLSWEGQAGQKQEGQERSSVHYWNPGVLLLLLY